MDATLLNQLELAARAAGYVPVGLTDDGTALLLDGIQQPWNPRDDNPHSDCMGDALRLAVKLQIIVGAYDNYANAGGIGNDVDVTVWSHEESDPCAATRRAIVRAAAQIGKAMP